MRFEVGESVDVRMRWFRRFKLRPGTTSPCRREASTKTAIPSGTPGAARRRGRRCTRGWELGVYARFLAKQPAPV